jgi:hypothetical protein
MHGRFMKSFPRQTSNITLPMMSKKRKKENEEKKLFRCSVNFISLAEILLRLALECRSIEFMRKLKILYVLFTFFLDVFEVPEHDKAIKNLVSVCLSVCVCVCLCVCLSVITITPLFYSAKEVAMVPKSS